MIERKDLLSLNFYESRPFTGSDGKMRYRVEKLLEETTDGASPRLQATVWPGPYAFAKTEDEKKTRHTAPFSEDGLQELTEWMNQQQPNF